VETDNPRTAHQLLATALEHAYTSIREAQKQARTHAVGTLPQWPAIVLRTPKGWLGPTVVDGLPIEGTFRAHQVPLSEVRTRPDHLAMLESWMRSYEPEHQFDSNGALVAELRALAPSGERRMGANPHANGGKLTRDLIIPPLSTAAVNVARPGAEHVENTRPFGQLLAGVFRANSSSQNVRLFCPDETNSNRLDDVFSVENRTYMEPIINIDDHLSQTGRVMEVLSEHLCEGWLEGYTLTGRHGIYASYEAFAMVSASMTVQHAKWLQHARDLTWRVPVPSLNILLTSTCWRNDHNGFSHQGPGLIDVMLSKRGTVTRIYLPPDANCLLSVADHCLRSRDYVNLMVIDKQPHLQYLDLPAAEQHCARGVSIWEWAGNAGAEEPDVVLASAGDVPTLELLAAAHWLRDHVPALKVRVVNIVDLMTMFPPDVHPHGISDERFASLFTEEKPVVFAFHGYQRAIHEIIHGRVNPARFHVRGFNEQGTTTTPFQMVVLNGMSRFQLASEALQRARPLESETDGLQAQLRALLDHAAQYATANFEDEPSISNWTWS
jgi:xylulose-5-phosphate/fructose-6-phosphate phosphoketolase